MGEVLLDKYVWKDDYKVNIASIDKHHQNFVELLNDLIGTVSTSKCKENIAITFYKLIYYAENYFTEEELLFQSKNYPNLEQHKAEHKAFADKINIFKNQFLEGKDNICLHLLAFLQKWFHEHILQYDKEAVDFLIENGVS